MKKTLQEVKDELSAEVRSDLEDYSKRKASKIDGYTFEKAYNEYVREYAERNGIEIVETVLG